jgi:peptidoglycan/LPS O-acetylase OafA/YrhL
MLMRPAPEPTVVTVEAEDAGGVAAAVVAEAVAVVGLVAVVAVAAVVEDINNQVLSKNWIHFLHKIHYPTYT